MSIASKLKRKRRWIAFGRLRNRRKGQSASLCWNILIVK